MSAEAWAASANVVMAGAAVAAAIAAFRGLSTWKKQNIWTADTDLARRIMIATYRYRDALYSVRHPAMSNSELRINEAEADGLPDAELRRRGVINAYAKRWERHSEKRNELDALLLEADAVWEEELSKLFEPLKTLEHELFVYIKLFLDANYYGDTELAKSYREILGEKRNILYDRLDDEKDDYRQDFLKALKPVEVFVRGKLGREQVS